MQKYKFIIRIKAGTQYKKLYYDVTYQMLYINILEKSKDIKNNLHVVKRTIYNIKNGHSDSTGFQPIPNNRKVNVF